MGAGSEVCHSERACVYDKNGVYFFLFVVSPEGMTLFVRYFGTLHARWPSARYSQTEQR